MGKGKDKITFSARKDPLLRAPRSAPPDRAPRAKAEAPSASRHRAATAAGARVRESPAGVIAVDPPARRPVPPAARAKPPGEPKPAAGRKPPADSVAAEASAASDQRGPPMQARRNTRRGEGRVQTSVSLPPPVWDALDELAVAASDSTGRLLIAILAAATPSTPAAAFATVERLLLSQSPDDALHEERNYRLPVDLRTPLDELASALGGGARRQRSLLIRAILAAHAPASATEARELLTLRRLAQLRPSEPVAA